MGKQGYFRFMLLIATIVVAVLPAAGCSVSQSNPSPAANPVAAPAPREGPREGIKVHGHWTIEVTNPDGTLVERRQFENALVGQGSTVLAKFLGRKNSVGSWDILLTASDAFTASGATPWVSPSGIALPGMIVESSEPAVPPTTFNNLLVEVPATGPNANKLELSGTATAQRAGTITTARTEVKQISATSPPSNSSSIAGNISVFTQQGFSPLGVSAGQQITVTIVISFS